jgi:hypothetical protein
VTTLDRTLNLWARVPILLRAIISGFLIAMVAANVWPLLLFHLGAPMAVLAKTIFLAIYVWWFAGGGFPRATQSSRAVAFRRTSACVAIADAGEWNDFSLGYIIFVGS